MLLLNGDDFGENGHEIFRVTTFISFYCLAKLFNYSNKKEVDLRIELCKFYLQFIKSQLTLWLIMFVSLEMRFP